MEASRKKQIFTIPNLLSVIRLIMIPIIIHWYRKGRFIHSAIMLFASGATDVIDGFIARRFNMMSDVGKVLDPVADKLTQVCMLACLLDRYRLMLIPVLLLAVKEIVAIIFGLMVIRKSGEVHSAVWHGKVSTVLLYAMMFLHLVWVDIPSIFSNITIILSTCMILVSFILYSKLNMFYLKESDAKK